MKAPVEIRVFCNDELSISADACECLTADHQKGMQQIRLERRDVHCIRLLRRPELGHRSQMNAVQIDMTGDAADGEKVGVRPQECYLPLESFRIGKIICIETRDKLCGASFQSEICRLDDPAIRLSMDFNSQIRRRHCGEDSRRSIGRAVIDDDDPKIRERLFLNTLDCAAYVGGTVVDGNQDIDRNVAHGLFVQL